MTSHFTNYHTVSGAVSSFVKPHGHVDGFVDVGTLVDIQKCLSESEKSDDIALARWVKEHYLQEPLFEAGRQIRDTEGFVKLDTAYRRVRQLTGKAQDKWPFFDRTWKKLSSTAVKNAILGKAAMGTTHLVSNGESRGSPMNNSFDGQHDHTLQTPKSQNRFGISDTPQDQVQEEKSPNLANLPPVYQQEPERKPQRQALYLSPTSRASSVSGTVARKYATDTSAINGSASPADWLRDAGAGKVRGPHGRFVNNSKTPPTVKKGPKIKYVKKSRTMAALEGRSEDERDSSDDGVKPPISPCSPASGQHPDGDGEVIQSSNPRRTATELTTDMQTADTTVIDSPVSSLLAAEAEAVPSNLDRLPPGLVGKKRKSESAIPRGGAKRGRGSRGGVLGRPRKSEPAVTGPGPDAEKGAETDQTSTQPEAPVKFTTRRTTRKSAAPVVESSMLWDPSNDVLLNGLEQERSVYKSKNPMINDANEILNGKHPVKHSHVDTTTIFETDPKTKDVIHKATNGNPVSSFQEAPASSRRKKRVSFSPEIEADNVEFFARITTEGGTQEISLSEGDLTSGGDIVKRYAAWQKSGEASITFETFKKIIKFAK